MERYLFMIRPAVSWLLLGILTGTSLVSGAQPSVVRLPSAFSLSAAEERQPEATEQPQPGTAAKDNPGSNGLHLVVVSGNNGINSLKKKITVRPVVRVLDGTDHPLEGVLVTFTAPLSGAGVDFGGGKRTTFLVSDKDGRATPASVKAVNEGPFVYRIRAIYQEQEATETLAQTNVQSEASTGEATPQASRTPTTGAARDHRFPSWGYAALIGGAAAGIGLGVALGTRQSAKTTATTPTATIGAPGSVAVGAP